MKFAHLADCHVGAWREPRMRDLTVQAFSTAIDRCIAEQVDFVIIAGDLFHAAIPSLDGVKQVFKSLAKLKAEGIPLYFVAGSHDYSPTGKTMLDVIEEASLGRNVFRGSVENGVLKLSWTIDEKTGVKLTGILGRANQLDSAIYTQIDRQSVEDEIGEKIFVFHTSLEELKPTGMIIDSSPLSLLPKGCTYYAGGHVHTRTDTIVDGRHIVYPGPLFPASFSELEELNCGSFCIVEEWQVRRELLSIKPVVSIVIECTGIAPANVPQAVFDKLVDVQDAIVLVRLSGVLAGKPSDVPWRTLTDELAERGAFVILRNTVALTSPELEKQLISTGSLPEIEEQVIAEHKVDAALVKELMAALSLEQVDGEKKSSYEERVIAGADATRRSLNANRR